MSTLEGRCVWVTGASSGIGHASVLALVARGAHVVASARRPERLEALRDATQFPERVLALPMDVTDADNRTRAFTAAARFAGGFDTLLHGAGLGQRSLASETPIAVDRQLMEVNYFAPVALTKLCLPHLRSREAAQIVVISSIVAYFAPPKRSAYAASKHALHGFFDALRAELSADGIAVTLVCPGWVNTEFRLSALTGEAARPDASEPRGISPERCARGVVEALQKREREVLVGGPEVLTVYAKRFAPGLLASALGRWRRS